MLLNEWRNPQVTQWKLDRILCEFEGKDYEIPEILWATILQRSGEHISSENNIFTAMLVNPMAETGSDTSRDTRSPRQRPTRSTLDRKRRAPTPYPEPDAATHVQEHTRKRKGERENTLDNLHSRKRQKRSIETQQYAHQQIR